jgi:hypothetical protein
LSILSASVRVAFLAAIALIAVAAILKYKLDGISAFETIILGFVLVAVYFWYLGVMALVQFVEVVLDIEANTRRTMQSNFAS